TSRNCSTRRSTTSSIYGSVPPTPPRNKSVFARVGCFTTRSIETLGSCLLRHSVSNDVLVSPPRVVQWCDAEFVEKAADTQRAQRNQARVPALCRSAHERSPWGYSIPPFGSAAQHDRLRHPVSRESASNMRVMRQNRSSGIGVVLLIGGRRVPPTPTAARDGA